MVAEAREVAPHRYRESYGRAYEDFVVGDVYEHRPGRTITETDNTWFTLLTMNQHPLHFDAAYAARSEFGRPLVNSCLTLSIVAGMSVADVSQRAIANLGWTDIRLPAPVFAGDTLYAESEVLLSATRRNARRRASSPSAPPDAKRTGRWSSPSSAPFWCLAADMEWTTMTDPMIERLCGAVSADAMMAHLQEFARHVKLSGTPEERESFLYLQAMPRRLRLAHRADRARRLYQPAGPGADRDRHGTPDCITHSFSRPSPPGGMRGRLVYAGAGRAEDFAAVDARGKIVLLEAIANPAASLRASRRARSGKSISARTSICTRCASRRSGAARPSRRGSVCRARSCSACARRMATH